MKLKVGELNGKSIVISTSPEEITVNEILLEKSIDGLSLKCRNDEGQLVSMINTFNKPVQQETGTKDVYINLNSSIAGPNKWVQGNDYLFYINKLETFSIVDNATREDITTKAKLVATGATNKVYKLPSNLYTSITIEEDL